ncbi:MAG: ATP-binding cassette domain-containing protein [Steroidobacteraceae bacterium]
MIRASGVSRRFNDFLAVDQVSFEVPEGEIFAFLGPNGAGKTTTIRMLTTLLEPSEGQIAIDGLDVTRHRAEVRRRFGIVFQDPSLDVELTALENLRIHGVLYGVSRRDCLARGERLLRMFELWERRNEPVKRYSGGMKRRLEIARSLLHTPRVIFLDEPTLGLDPQTRNQLWNHVRALNEDEKVTVFLTTHYMDEAEKVAQRIAIIDHGRIVAQGSAAELRTQTGTESLEEAFLALTGAQIREEGAAGNDFMRQMIRNSRR